MSSLPRCRLFYRGSFPFTSRTEHYEAPFRLRYTGREKYASGLQAFLLPTVLISAELTFGDVLQPSITKF